MTVWLTALALVLMLMLAWHQRQWHKPGQQTQTPPSTLDVLRHSEEKLRAIIDAMPGVFILYDQNAHPVLWNQNVETVLGISAEAFARSSGVFIVPEDIPRVTEIIRASLQGACCSIETQVLTPDGRRIPYLFNSAPLGQNPQMGFLAFGLDLSKQKKDAEDIYRLANYDSLTGLPNRTLLLERLEQTLALSYRHQGLAALLLLDIGRF
ncbi:MAG: PAS domain S-box protein [Gammaproteobacteria bacterium]|nr:PAS domain S-box protein [Gammaproteobacteria bacterium]